MTAFLVPELWCDGGSEGCAERFTSDTADTARGARALARDRGWGRRRTYDGSYVDLCPRHLTEFDSGGEG